MQRTTLPAKVVVSLLKQWMNHMKARDREAASRFQALRRITDLDEFLAGLGAQRIESDAAPETAPDATLRQNLASPKHRSEAVAAAQ